MTDIAKIAEGLSDGAGFYKVQGAIRAKAQKIANENGEADARWWSEALAEAAVNAVRDYLKEQENG